MTDSRIRRPQYFKGQLLKDDDFIAEQEYHMQMRRLHNATMHVWGVVEGLKASVTADGLEVRVSPGMAIDKEGKEIRLSEEHRFSASELNADGRYYIVIVYKEVDDEPYLPDQTKYIRKLETGELRCLAITQTTGALNWVAIKPRPASLSTPPDSGPLPANPTDDTSLLKLARLTVTGGKLAKAPSSDTADDPDNSVRRAARNLRENVQGDIEIGPVAKDGSLRLMTGAPLTERLTIDATGKVGIGTGTTGPQSTLHIKGNGGILSLEGTGHAHIQFYPLGFDNGRKGWIGYRSDNEKDLWIRSAASDGDIIICPEANRKVRIDTNPNVSSAATLLVGRAPQQKGNATFFDGGSAVFNCAVNNGGSTPAAAETVVVLAREGVENQAGANFARFNLKRFEHARDKGSRTQLDIGLSHGALEQEANNTPVVLSLRSDGNVGIGTNDSGASLSLKPDSQIIADATSLRIGTNKMLILQTGGQGRLSIDSSGKVGIGTATSGPGDRLQVGWACYKFSVGDASEAPLDYGTSYAGFNVTRIRENGSSKWNCDGDSQHNGGALIYGDIFGKLRFVTAPSTGGSAQYLDDSAILNKTRMRINEQLVDISTSLAIKGGERLVRIDGRYGTDSGDSHVFSMDHTPAQLAGVRSTVASGDLIVVGSERREVDIVSDNRFVPLSVKPPAFPALQKEAALYVVRPDQPILRAVDYRGNEAFLISADRNVGIGTATPDANYKLDVAGMVKAAGFDGSGSGITGINADNITTGRIRPDRLPELKDITGQLSVERINGSPIPGGVIVMWSGAYNAVPAGWQVCDGQNGTPDLRNRFIVGAGSAYSVGNTGGLDTVTLSINQMPSHNHASGDRDQLIRANTRDGCTTGSLDRTDSEPNVRDQSSTIQTVGGGQAHENRPPYYALCFIMKLFAPQRS